MNCGRMRILPSSRGTVISSACNTAAQSAATRKKRIAHSLKELVYLLGREIGLAPGPSAPENQHQMSFSGRRSTFPAGVFALQTSRAAARRVAGWRIFGKPASASYSDQSPRAARFYSTRADASAVSFDRCAGCAPWKPRRSRQRQPSPSLQNEAATTGRSPDTTRVPGKSRIPVESRIFDFDYDFGFDFHVSPTRAQAGMPIPLEGRKCQKLASLAGTSPIKTLACFVMPAVLHVTQEVLPWEVQSQRPAVTRFLKIVGRCYGQQPINTLKASLRKTYRRF